MTAPAPSDAMLSFIDYFGELGPRWGLGIQPCRVHAYLYLVGRPVAEPQIIEALALDAAECAAAIAYLAQWRMITRAGGAQSWMAGGDPWDMLLAGLEERRQRELEPALKTLRACHSQALAERTGDGAVGRRIGDVVRLVEDIAAIDMQARRISPRALRQMVGLSGRAARFLDRTFGGRRGGDR